MEDHREREVKFDLALGAELPDLAGVVKGLSVLPRPEIGLRADYFDTADLRLLRRGVTLRHRRELSGLGEDSWTLKVPASGPGGRMADRVERSWPDRHGELPDEAVGLVRGLAGGSPLELVAQLSTVRRRVELVDRKGTRLAEVDDDVVTITAGGTGRFREIEVELDRPDRKLERQVAAGMAKGGAARSGQQPKLRRALRRRLRSLEGSAPRRPPRHGFAPSAKRALDELLAVEVGIRVGQPEAVHRARVALRRLRSELKTHRDELDAEWRRAVVADVRWLGGALGAVRDLDILRSRLAGAAHATGAGGPGSSELVERLDGEHAAATAALAEAYDSGRYLVLLRRLEAGASDRPAGARGRGRAAVRSGVRRSGRRYLRHEGVIARRPTPERLHALRKDAKRLRYSAESAAAVGAVPARLAKRAEAVQGSLGAYHDAVVAEAWLTSAAATSSPAAAFAAGLAVAAERTEQRRVLEVWAVERKALRKAARRSLR